MRNYVFGGVAKALWLALTMLLPGRTGAAAADLYPRGASFCFTFYSTKTNSPITVLTNGATTTNDSAYVLTNGATALGPFYGDQTSPLAEAIAYNAKLIYKVTPPCMSNASAAVFDSTNWVWPSDAIITNQVAAIIAAVQTNANIALWDFQPEELRPWKTNELHYFQIVCAAIHASDPTNRPVYNYQPNDRDVSTLTNFAACEDICTKGMYVSANVDDLGNTLVTNRIWARWSMDQELGAIAAANTNAPPWIHLWMGADPPAGFTTTDITNWCRHDAYMGLIKGGKGVEIWSGSEGRTGFADTNFYAYLNGYLSVAKDLNGALGLAPVFLYGQAQSNVTMAIIGGPATQTLYYDSVTNIYPSITYRSIVSSGTNYLFMVNSAQQAVTATFSGLPAVARLDLFAGTNAPTPGGSFSITLPPLVVKAFQSFDHPPSFPANPFSPAAATVGFAYSNSIAANATDLDLPSGDVLVFTKLSGPTWLTVATNGVITGTPTYAYYGTNTFTVMVTDTAGASATATMLLLVNAPNCGPTVVWSESFTNQTLTTLTNQGWTISGQTGAELVSFTANSAYLGTISYLRIGSNTASQPFGQKSFGTVNNGQFKAIAFTTSSYSNARIKLLNAGGTVLFDFYLSGVNALAVENITPAFSTNTMPNGGTHNLLSTSSPLGYTEFTVTWGGSNLTWQAVNRNPTNGVVVYDTGIQSGTFTNAGTPSQLRLDTGTYNNSARYFGTTDMQLTDTTGTCSNQFVLTYLAGANGVVGGASPQVVNTGANGTAVTVTANTGYSFVSWSDGSTANPRTDVNVTSNITVTANFAINTFTLTYLASANGAISGTATQTVNYGANGTAVTAMAGTNYHFVNWNDGSIANPRTDANVTSNLTVTANFATNISHTLTYLAGTNGSINGTTPQTVSYGASGTAVTAAASAGYQFVNWSDGSTANPRTDVNVTSNLTVTASFAALPSQLVLNGGFETGNFLNWALSGNTAQYVNVNSNYVHTGSYGAELGPVGSLGYISQTLTTVPGQSYALSFWLMDGASGGTNRIFLAKWNSTTVYAITNKSILGWTNLIFTIAAAGASTVLQFGFENDPFYYGLDDITVTPVNNTSTFTLAYLAGTGGTLSGTTPQTVNNGASGTAVSAAANTGYYFLNWSDGSTANPRTDANVTSNLTVTANFAINTYTLTYLAGTNGTISGVATQAVSYGASGNAVTAVANTGYHFVNWSDGVMTGSRTDTGVTNNLTVTANFLAGTNTPPVFPVNPFSVPAATVGFMYSNSIATNVTDPDLTNGDVLTFSKLSGPLWLTVATNGVITGIPDYVNYGTNAFTVQVMDASGASNTATMILPVISPNCGPTLLWSEDFAGKTLSTLTNQGWTISGQTNTAEAVQSTVNSAFLGTLSYLRVGSSDPGQPFGQKSFGLVTNGQFKAIVFTPSSYSNARIKLLNTGGTVLFDFLLAGVNNLAVENINPIFSTNPMPNSATHNLLSTSSPPLGYTEFTVTWGGSNLTWQAVNHNPTNGVVVYDTGIQFGAFTNTGVPSQLRLDTGTYNNSARYFGTTAIQIIDTTGTCINQSILTYLAGANGAVSGNTTQIVTNGGNGSAVSAVPNTGCSFVNWSDGSIANPRTDLNVTSNLAVTANFTINTYTLTYTAGTNGAVSGMSPQTVNYGASGSAVTAVPNSGYSFTNWSDGIITVSRTDMNVVSNITVMANFVALPPAPPVILSGGVNVSGGSFNFQFTGTPGLHYRVEGMPALPASGSWLLVTDILSLATSPCTVSIHATNGAGFYRVSLVSP